MKDMKVQLRIVVKCQNLPNEIVASWQNVQKLPILW
jgi:hypothetical protein